MFFYFRKFTGKCFSRASTHALFVSRGKILGKSIFFCDQIMFFIYSFGDNSVAVLSELHSVCPVERLDGKNTSKEL